jgi:hypothetical protein
MTDLLDRSSPEQSGAPGPEPDATPALAIDVVRDLVLRAYPDVVPELVRGETLDDLLSSIEPASTAYISLAARFDKPAVHSPEPVPAGATPPVPIDIDRLPTAEKLRRGISERLRHSR